MYWFCFLLVKNNFTSTYFLKAVCNKVERHFTFVSGKTEQYHIEKIPRSSAVSAARFTLEDKNKHTMLLHFCIDIFWSRPCSYYGI